MFVCFGEQRKLQIEFFYKDKSSLFFLDLDECIPMSFLINNLAASLSLKIDDVSHVCVYDLKNAHFLTEDESYDLVATLLLSYRASEKIRLKIVMKSQLDILLTDSLVLEICREYIGMSPQKLSILMRISQRFNRIFSSDEAWSGIELSFKFLGYDNARGNNYHSAWSITDSGLPLKNARRVEHVALVSNRMRVFLGAIQNKWYHNLLRAIGLENVVSSHWPTIYFIGNINSSVVHLHESVGQLLSPHTAIFQRLDGLEYIGIQQHQKMFALQVHDSKIEDQTIPLANVSGIFLCVDVLMSNIDEKKIMKELAELLQCYCIRKSRYDATDPLSNSADDIPIVVMLPILDLQYFQDMNLDYGSAIQALNELVGVIMVQNLGNKRTWLIQTMNPQTISDGFVAGCNYMIRKLEERCIVV